jgi:hypothetical protein
MWRIICLAVATVTVKQAPLPLILYHIQSCQNEKVFIRLLSGIQALGSDK